MSDTPADVQATYGDEDMVYVDPKLRVVIGRVEWDENGTPMKKEMVLPAPREEEDADDDEPKGGRRVRKPRKRYYPWGTYRTMKKLYRIEGKEKEIAAYQPLEEAMAKAAQEPFWD